MRLIFVRHGEPDYENDCLTENGIKQAMSTAKRLADEPIAAVYSSPMGRARQTASFTAENHGLNVEILDFMHEIDWGDISKDADSRLPFDGHPWTLGYKLLTEEQGYVGSPEWSRHHYFKDNKCMGFYERLSGEIDGFLARYGLERKDGLYFCRESRDETIALFAHGGSGAILFSHVLSLPFPFVLTTLPYGVCSVSVIEFGCEQGKPVIPRLELFNDMGHIESFKQEKLHFEK